MECERDAATRRQVLKYGGALAAVGALAGCSQASGDGPEPARTNEPAETDSPTDSETPAGTTTPGVEPYAVSIEPVGEVTFESVPETWVANNGSWADMGIALGFEPPEAVWLTGRYHTEYYESIPDVDVSTANMVSLYQDGVSKELFYDLNGQVHVMDPNFLQNRFKGWTASDVAEIESNVAPFFGNCIYAQHYPWHDDYRYYSLYEGFEKLAQVFQRTDRYEAMAEVHDDFKSTLAPHVPGQADRPEAAVLWGVGDQPEQFYPYVIDGGTSFKHMRDLGVPDALAGSDIKDFHASRAAIDLETLLEIDPEVLLLRGYEAKDRDAFEDTVVSFLAEHDTASALTAVETREVYRAGGLYVGPITNLVVTERLAGRLYGVSEPLFDRERVADVVHGNIA